MEGFTDDRAANDSKGAGAIMRIAPAGLAIGRNGEEHAGLVFNQALRISWITHGHPSGYLSAAAFAVIIHALLLGQPLEGGITAARALVEADQDGSETLAKIDQAVIFVRDGTPPDEALPAIGQGWVGEEALGIAIYCAGAGRDFASAVRLAVNHDGDSDTTGALVGQLLGVRDGEGEAAARMAARARAA